MRQRPLLRRVICFAVAVLAIAESVNFPLPLGDWRVKAVAVSVVNLLIFLIAVASGLLGLRLLRSRVIPVTAALLAGILSGLELIQFAPFAFPLSFPPYTLIGGILGSAIPMTITLFILGYLLSKRRAPAPQDPEAR